MIVNLDNEGTPVDSSNLSHWVRSKIALIKYKLYLFLGIQKNRVSTVQYGAFKIYGLFIVPFLPIPTPSLFVIASETESIYPPVPYTGISPFSKCL